MTTKQEMLDIINLKIASTSQSDEGTGCFLPIGIGKLSGRFLDNKIIDLWGDIRTPLDKQSNECIKYVFNLLQK